jgi:hypothetical protein
LDEKGALERVAHCLGVKFMQEKYVRGSMQGNDDVDNDNDNDNLMMLMLNSDDSDYEIEYE